MIPPPQPQAARPGAAPPIAVALAGGTPQENVAHLDAIKKDISGGINPPPRPASPPLVPQGPGELKAKEEKRLGHIKLTEKMDQDIIEKAPAAREVSLNLKAVTDSMEDLAKNDTPTGKMRTMKNNLFKLADGMGIELTPSERAAIANATVVEKLNATLASAATRAMTARPALLEFVTFMESNPNLEMTPEAMRKVIHHMEVINDIHPQLQKDFAVWKQHHPNGIASPADFQQYMHSRIVYADRWQGKSYADLVNTYNSMSPDQRVQYGYKSLDDYVNKISSFIASRRTK
jgi:hypothetical protein